MAQEVLHNTIILITIFFLLLVAVIIVTANLYYNRKRSHNIDLANFQNELIKTQLEVQEQTMQTIGADLHDNIGQLLSLTSLTLNSIEIENRLRSQQKIETAIDLTLRSIKELRLLGKLLQGDQLLVLGLAEAIRHEINWLERSGQYEIVYEQERELPATSNANKDLILFRILQEILNNIIKHARATRITIKLDYNEELLLLQISDNGVGFDISNMPVDKLGMGLQNINKRAAIVGGKANIVSEAGQGTSVVIFIPYP